MSIFNRASQPTPPFWKKVRNIAITVGSIAGVLVAAPIALPVGFAAALPYVITFAATLATAAQTTTGAE